MDHRPKCKTQSIKLEDNMGENPGNPGYGNVLYNRTTKTWSMKEMIDKVDFIKIKNSAPRKTIQREWENESHTGRKYLQKRHLKGTYLKYI